MMIELESCPFCGSEATVEKIPEGLNWSGLYVVGCDKDDMCMGNINHFTMIFTTPETAAETWNKRANNKVGHWIWTNRYTDVACSVCHKEPTFDDTSDYCGNCGAEMSEPTVFVDTRKEALKEGAWLLEEYRFEE